MPSSYAINQAVKLLPMPGGPEIRQALAFGLGASAQFPNLALTSFFHPLMTTSFQSQSHSHKESTAALFPTI